MAAPVPPPPVPPAAPPAPVRYDLRIEALFNVRGRWPKPRFAIQNEPFHLVLRFANTGATVFPGCRVRGIHIQVTGESQPLSSNIREEFAIPVLNPGQSTELEVGRFNLAFEGVTWVDVPWSQRRRTSRSLPTKWTQVVATLVRINRSTNGGTSGSCSVRWKSSRRVQTI